MGRRDSIGKAARDSVEGQVHLRLSPLAALIVRSRWFRNLSGLTVRPVSSVWSPTREAQGSNHYAESKVTEEQLGPEELRIIRRNALASALMRSSSRWGR